MISTIRKMIAAAAEDCDVSPTVIIVLVSIPFVLPLATIAAGILHRPTFDLLTGEDQLGEWLQVAAWLGAIIFTTLLLSRLVRARESVYVALYGCFLAGMIFIVGEEISWGQRIFGFSTPDSLIEINRQRESNLHNIYGVQTMFSWAMFIVGAYGTIVPSLAAWRWGRYRDWPLFVKRLSPHWVLIPFFLLMLVWRTYRNLFEPLQDYYYAISQFGETTELVLATAFLIFAWHQWRMRPSESAGGVGTSSDMTITSQT